VGLKSIDLAAPTWWSRPGQKKLSNVPLGDRAPITLGILWGVATTNDDPDDERSAPRKSTGLAANTVSTEGSSKTMPSCDSHGRSDSGSDGSSGEKSLRKFGSGFTSDLEPSDQN
jgi:hypothetical protein